MWNNTSEFIGLYASWGITALFLPFARLLPDSTDQTNEITVITPASRPHLSKPANRWRRSSRRGRATQVTQEKNRKERKKKLRGLLWSSCETNTDFHPSLPVKPVSLDRTHSSTSTGRVSNRKLFRGSSENNLPPFFLSPFTSIEFPALLFALLITWKKVNPRVIFILIFALIVVFTLVVPDGFAQWYSGGVLWGNSWCKWG